MLVIIKTELIKKTNPVLKLAQDNKKKIMKESNKSYQLKYLTSEFKKSSINFVKFSINL